MRMVEFNGKSYPDGRASDSIGLGWMRGAPPAPDKQIVRDLDSYLDFPKLRWSLSHLREILPSVNIERGTMPSPLPREAHRKDLEDLVFSDVDGHRRTFGEALFDTYSDGLIVMHQGRVIYERYFGALEEHLPHACFSITKSFAGTLAAALVHEGALDPAKLVSHYVSELRGTAWQDATLRQVMDMQTGLLYSEEYTDEHSGVRGYGHANGFRARPVGYAGPTTLYDYLLTVRKEGEHGQEFAYKTPNTDILAWVLARVTGKPLAKLLHERIWAPLGFEQDGHLIVDTIGTPLVGGGMSACLRDLARFGELMRREGDWDGRQVLPASAVHEVASGGDPSKFNYSWLPGYSYRNMWWVSHNELGAFEARGIYGQRLYVAPNAEMVVARFASHPVASSAGNDPITLPQFLALGRALQA